MCADPRPGGAAAHTDPDRGPKARAIAGQTNQMTEALAFATLPASPEE